MNSNVLLEADQILQFGEIDDLRGQALVEERLVNVDPFLQHRNSRLNLRDAGGSGAPLGFLLAQLAIDRRKFGILLGALADQKLTVRLDLGGSCALRRAEGGKRIIRERRSQPGGVEFGADKIAFLTLLIGLGHCGIELDKNVAGLDRLTVPHVDGANHAGIEWLDQLGSSARHDLSCRRCDDIHAAERCPCEGDAEDGDDACSDRAPDRRRRRLRDLEGCRQERDFGLAAADFGSRKCNDVFSGSHGCLLAGNAASHNGRSTGSARRDGRPRQCGLARW